MAFTFDSTVGGASTNSYATVTEADDYFDSFLFSDDWTDLSTLHKQKLLTMAWRVLNTLRYGGDRVTVTQNSDFPRNDLYDWDGNDYTTTTIPAFLKDAQAEIAYYLLSTDNRYVNELGEYGTVSTFKGGAQTVTFDPTTLRDNLPTKVRDLLLRIGPNIWKSKTRSRRLAL